MKRVIVMGVTAALGAGAAFGVAACGDEERGTVEIEGGTTGTAGTVGTAPTGPSTLDELPTAPETTPTSP